MKKTCAVATAGSAKDSTADGTFTLPYIADENADEDPEFKVAVTGDSKAAQQLREVFLTRGKQVRCAAYSTVHSTLFKCEVMWCSVSIDNRRHPPAFHAPDMHYAAVQAVRLRTILDLESRSSCCLCALLVS